MLILTYEGIRIEIRHKPRFEVKANTEGYQEYLEGREMEVFDPIKLEYRFVSPKTSEYDCYLFFNHLRLGGANIEFIELPEYPVQETPQGALE